MRAWQAILLIFWAGAAWAQEDDRDYLTAFLEDSLSGVGREVTITGFSGALSSRATIESLTIADDEGIWLALTGVTLDWSRSALLSGTVDVSELSAESIEVFRLPAGEDGALPSPEATEFSLPDLPVSISVDRLSAGTILLDESVLGQAVQGTMDATIQLADGVGAVTLNLLRVGDGPSGDLTLDASFDNATGLLSLDLSASEAAGGIVASSLDLPGAPSAALAVVGSGPLDDFSADVSLSTDGEARLSGKITVSGQAGDLRMRADVGGNLAPLLVPDQVDFFGSSLRLSLDATRTREGLTRVDRFGIQARSITVEGSASLAADGLPEEVMLTGVLASPDGAPLVLPFSGASTRIDRARFDLSVRNGIDSGWTADIALEGLSHPGVAADSMTLSGSGRIGKTSVGNSLGGTLTARTTGLALADPALAQAVGQSLSGSLRFHVLEGSGALTLSDIRLMGEGVEATASGRIEGLDKDLLTTGRIVVQAEDLSRFSGLAGRPLKGSGSFSVAGSTSGLTGFVDAEAELVAEGLSVDLDLLDRGLAGTATARLSVLRDVAGTKLRSFDIATDALAATASGTLATAGSDLSGRIAISDLSRFGQAYGGGIDLEGRFAGTLTDGDIRLSGATQDLRTGVAEADRLLAGRTTLIADLGLKDGEIRLDAADLANARLGLTAVGKTSEGAQRVELDGRLANLGLIVPRLDGQLTLRGTVSETPGGLDVDLSLRGPSQIDSRVAGQIDTALTSGNLSINGSGEAVLANLFIAPRALEGQLRYDLRLAGPFRLSSLSGRLTMTRGRLTDPNLGFAVEGIEGVADLSGGQARVSATGGISSGGRLRVEGPVGLSAPYPANLAIALERVRLYDPELYETTLDGSLGLTGPLAGGAVASGAVNLGQTEIRVPSSGFQTAGQLSDLHHVNEPPAVRETRARAGLLDGAGGRGARDATGRPYRVDILVTAASQVFVRGRGIDAELGGQLRLAGTSEAIVPSGGFSLVRGRLDILGKRLVLSRAELVLQGSFVPVLEIAASTTSDGVVSEVTIEGPADDPQVAFSSTPPLPQEEVLARLLFGRGLETISALQAAQLANAVAVLAGRGGEGLVSRLRKGFGLDDLDLATAEDGTTALTVGKYLTENMYTEVEVQQGGKARISLNLDLRDGVTAKAGIGDDGEAGVGIFLQKDY